MLETERQLIEPSANVRVDAARDKGKREGRTHTYRKQKQMKKTRNKRKPKHKRKQKHRGTEKTKHKRLHKTNCTDKPHTQTAQTCKTWQVRDN